VHLGYLRPHKHKYDPTTRKVHAIDTAESGKKEDSKDDKEDALVGEVGAAASILGAAVEASKNSKTAGSAGAQGAEGKTKSTGAAADADAEGPGIPEVDVTAGINGGLTDANPPDAADSVGLDIDANDTGYVATVSLGTPPADYLVLMDSGSSDFWVGAGDCQTLASEGGGPCAANHKTLSAASSSSFVDSGTPFNVTYGSGSVAGTIVTDNVVLAGLALPGHTFGVAHTESTDFSASTITFDGLMGLAQQGLSQQGVPTPVESLASAGLIPAAITSFKLSRLADGLNDGEVTFGALDPEKFVANTLVTLPNVNTEGFWEGAMDAVTVDGASAGLKGRTAILDTGTTLVLAPPDDAAAVHALIPGSKSDGQGGFTIPCLTNASVALTFAGTPFPIDVRDLLFEPVDANDLTGDCVSGITAGEIGGAQEWLVGDVFLKNAYFVVNEGKNEIQLAKLA